MCVVFLVSTIVTVIPVKQTQRKKDCGAWASPEANGQFAAMYVVVDLGGSCAWYPVKMMKIINRKKRKQFLIQSTSSEQTSTD